MHTDHLFVKIELLLFFKPIGISNVWSMDLECATILENNIRRPFIY